MPAVAVVAQRLCDILQTFPAAASTGVQWETLIRKYEDVHSSSLDIAALGHSTATAAASALLWDVLRVVNREDVDNPIVAVEEGVALSPRPGYLATWPSLYAACCEAVNQYGTPDTSCTERNLLLSQLKPLLQTLWHSNFTECGLTYFGETGTSLRPKKMKHLLNALIQWREEYMASRTAGVKGALDEALEARLELVPSSKHNDLMLRCCPSSFSTPQPVVPLVSQLPLNAAVDAPPPLARGKTLWSDVDVSENDELWEIQSTPSVAPTTPSSGCTGPMVSALEQEVAILRAENAALKICNERMLLSELYRNSCQRPLTSEPEIFDDPFEPPPQAQHCQLWSTSSLPSTEAPSGYGTPIGHGTPTSSVADMRSFSAAGPFSGQMCTFVPILVECAQIPNGIVQQARSLFEKSDSTIPSFFCQDKI
jgi:hypothetical protein